MSTKVESNFGFASKPSISWLQIWRTAVTRPTVAAYQDLFQLANPSASKAWLWLFVSSLLSGALISIAPFVTESAPAGLALAVLVFAVSVVLVWAIFAGCTHAVARLFHGRGAYTALIYLFAAFSTPLVLFAGVVSLLPRSGLLLGALYLYWLILYVVATQAVYQISRAKALIAVLIAFLLVGSALFGLGVGMLVWGISAWG
jgi:hypothetical protein